MPETVSTISLGQYIDYWQDDAFRFEWPCLFTSPPWISAWVPTLGADVAPCLLSVRRDDRIVGFAPIYLKGNGGCLLGSANVCDYLDFAVTEGEEIPFFLGLFAHLREIGVQRLDLQPLHPESSVCRALPELADRLRCDISWEADEPVYEMALPGSWDGYLNRLSGKHRHEVRRKFRRLEDAGDFQLRTIEEPGISDGMDAFLSLFRLNRSDKSEFMTGEMETYFRTLASELGKAGILKLQFLDIDDETVAATLCFDYRSTIYLYNNGYDDRFRALSVGMMSKLLSIKDGIAKGKQMYSFLKGAEPYKAQLGGEKVMLQRCHVRL